LRVVRALVALLLIAGTAHAERYVMQRGETLEHVAAAYGCSTDALMRANNVKTTLLRPGTVITIPECSIRARARVRVTTPKPRVVVTRRSDDDGFTPLADDDGYFLRRPSRAYGESNVIKHLESSIAVVRALYPDVHTLAVGDISAEHGGKLANHLSHRKGLDVDVGFYFKRMPDGYPARFAAADDNLDLEATWALLTAFARTTGVADGVEIMFLDYAVQKRLYDWALKRGTPEDDLAAILQYPRGKDTLAGLVRHWPNHTDHIHVRFRAAHR
jgi:LysM repeat protein